ncbi:MAG: hypothetical protein Q8N83_02135 [Ignavibacteria bacterium]|nr:hypothetical protein [Ignavibacteria bacterium]
MKTVLCSVLLLLVLSNITSGQSSPSNFNPNILVHSQGLPNEFLLFVPDTATQILFNPARANDYAGSFVYSTYAADFKRNNYMVPLYVNSYLLDGDIIYTTPAVLNKNASLATINNLGNSANYSESFTSGKNPTIAVATLFTALNSKWLFLFSNGLSKQNGTKDITSENRHPDSYYKTYQESTSSNEEVEASEARTSFRLSNIFSSGEGKSSISLFASFNTSLDNSNRNSLSNTLRSSNSLPLYHHSNNGNQIYIVNEENSTSEFGFEFSLANEKWDYIARVSYQKSTENTKNSSYSNQESLDSTYYGSSSTPISSSNRNNSTNSTNYSTHSEPYIFAFENYYQHKTSFFSLDGNFFVSASINYSSGDGKIGGDSFYRYEYYNNGVLTSHNSRSNSSEQKFADKNWGFTFTPGFVLKKNFTDLFLFTGIKIETGYHRYSSGKTESASVVYDTNYPFFVTTSKTKETFVSVTLPVYINYTPAEWISIWGGMNYSYGYNKSVIASSTSSTSSTIPSYPQTYSVNTNNDNSSFQSSKSTFLGLQLKHPSGLRVQISFDEDVASFRDWNMSVGYHF